MVNREVRHEILANLAISASALSQRAKHIKDKYGPMTTDEAVYIIAHTEGIDLSKHLPLEILDQIRSLIPREIKPKLISAQKVSSRKKVSKHSKSANSYPLVSNDFIQKVISIGDEAFPQIVVLENSIRSLIRKSLSAVRSDWWSALIPVPVQKNVQRIIDKEKKYPHREKRSNDTLMYCNFADLKVIIINNYPRFSDVILDAEWFKVKMDEVYMARNNLAHSILLSKEDISRIALFYTEWARLLETANIK